MGVSLLAFAISWGLLRWLLMISGAYHLDQTRSFFQSSFSKLDYLGAWIMNQLLLIGQGLVFAPSWLARLVAAALLLALILPAFRCSKARGRPGLWMVLGTSGALIFWPYLGTRYWLLSLPILLLSSLRALPPKAWRLVLPALCLLEIIFVAKGLRRDDYHLVKPTRELYQSLASLDRSERVATVCPARVHIMSHLPTEVFLSAPSIGLIARNLAVEKCDVLIWEHHFPLVINMGGGVQVETPAYLGLWLERSGMFQVLYSNEAGVVVRLLSSQADIEAACQAWKQALEARTLVERDRWLEQGLQRVPDFYELRALRLLDDLQVKPFPKQRALPAILDLAKQYPHDFQLAGLILQGLRKSGNTSGAAEVAKLYLAEAQRLGDRKSAAGLQRFLEL
jgi:hypothetical protein